MMWRIGRLVLGSMLALAAAGSAWAQGPSDEAGSKDGNESELLETGLDANLEALRQSYAEGEQAFFAMLEGVDEEQRRRTLIEEHPIELYLPQFETLAATARERGAPYVESAALVDRVLLRSRYVSAETDVTFVRPTLEDLLSRHAASPELERLAKEGEALVWLIGPMETRGFLDRVRAASPHHAVKAAALFSLARLSTRAFYESGEETRSAVKVKTLELYAQLQKNFPYTRYAEIARDDVRELESLQPGSRSPYWNSVDQDRVNLYSDFPGSVVLLEFWGEWCGPSLEVLEDTAALVDRFQFRPLVVIGVNSDPDPKKTLNAFLESSGIRASMDRPGVTWFHSPDPQGSTAALFNVRKWPTNFLIDAEGIIRGRDLFGPALLEAIEPMIEEAEETRFVQLLETQATAGVSVALNDDIEAYLSLATLSEPDTPALVLVPSPEMSGEIAKAWADRLSQTGYTALAVELEASMPPQRARQILELAWRFLEEDERVRASDRRGLIAWGANTERVLNFAAEAKDARAVVLADGVLTGELRASSLPPTLALFAQDVEAETFRDSLKRAQPLSEAWDVEAPSGFHDPRDSRYQATEASRCWGLMSTFLRRHLRGE